jgi:hypothetical protein
MNLESVSGGAFTATKAITRSRERGIGGEGGIRAERDER